jgi:uncharacterized protein (DUF2235 family)
VNVPLELINTSLQLIQTIAVIAALIYGWQQIRDARRESNLGAAWQIFAELSDEQQRQARGYVYRHREQFEALSQDPATLYALDRGAWDAAHSVGNTFNRIGYLVHRRLLSEDLVLEGYGHIIARCWIVLERFVYAIRERRGEDQFQKYFEYLANRYFAQYASRVEISDIQFVEEKQNV